MVLGTRVSVSSGPGIFRRLILPGLAFKAIVIGGGYATGRELAEYFLPSGPRGGVAGMLLAMSIWSVVCATTFLFARLVNARDYRSFFRHLLGPFWFTFEWMYVLFLILVLSIFGAAAGAIGTAVFGWPRVLGTLLLMAGIALVTAFGNDSVERLFKWVSVLLYVTYVVSLTLGLANFGSRIIASFRMPTPTDGWAAGGLAYAGYNIIGAVVILPVVRHLRTDGDALRAGLLAGPLAIMPALLFFICMCAYYPQVGLQVLPSDFLLRQLNIPAFQVAFQIMIFFALLESGTGSVHAVNERIAATYAARAGRSLSRLSRLSIAVGLLLSSVVLAERFGLVTLIARGYRAFAYVILSIYVLPLMTFGVWRLLKEGRSSSRPEVRA